jgi:LysM repeat protein
MYDKTLPTLLNKMVKKLDPDARIEFGTKSADSKFEPKYMSSGAMSWLEAPEMEGWNKESYDPVNAEYSHIKITPTMKEAILKGQPLFMAEGGLVAGYNHGGLMAAAMKDKTDNETQDTGLMAPDNFTLNGGSPKALAPQQVEQIQWGKGDTLYQASRVTGIPVDTLAQWHGGVDKPVMEGETLQIPTDYYTSIETLPDLTPAQLAEYSLEAPSVDPVSYTYTDDRGTETSKGIRNNNPANVEWKKSNPWDGLAIDQTADKRFAIFDNAEHGIRAAIRTLVTYQDDHDLQTIQGMISRWSPITDKGNVDAKGRETTTAYIKNVADAVGISKDINMVVGNNENTRKMIKAMIKQENGAEVADHYADEVYTKALNLAFPTDNPQASLDKTDWENVIS